MSTQGNKGDLSCRIDVRREVLCIARAVPLTQAFLKSEALSSYLTCL